MIVIGNKSIKTPNHSGIYIGGKKYYGSPDKITGVAFYASTMGTSLGDGSISNPWDLQTALSHPVELQAGDTLFLRGGKYVGEFISELSGTEGKIIKVKPYNNELVFIVGTLNIFGSPSLDIIGDYCYFYDLHVTNGDKVSEPVGINEGSEGIRMMAPNSKIINCIVHDNGGNGISFWTPAVNSEVYGCVMYNNGWREVLEGHNIYISNFDGTKTVKHNIVFNSAAFGIHAYSEGQENLWLQNVDILQNVCFNNGILNGYKLERSIIAGSTDNPSKNIRVNGNLVYHKAPINFTVTGAINLGYEAVSENAIAEDNYVYGGTSSLHLLAAWESLSLKRNTFINANETFLTKNKIYTGYDIEDNEYYLGTIDGNTFVQWQGLGFDLSGSYSSQLPQTNVIFIHPNEHESGRANVTVWNWEAKSSIDLDISLFLNDGDDYFVYDVQKFASGPISQGVVSGSTLSIPINNTIVDAAFGNEPDVYNPAHTDNEFISLIIAKRIITSIEPTGIYPLRFNGINTYLQLSEVVTNAAYFEIELTLDEIVTSGYFFGNADTSPAIGYINATDIRIQGTVGNKVITPVITEEGFINFKFERIESTNSWTITINNVLFDTAENIGDIPFIYIARRGAGNYYPGQIKKFLVKDVSDGIIFNGDFYNLSGKVLVNKAENLIRCNFRGEVKWNFLPEEIIPIVELVSIAVTPVSVSIVEGFTRQFTAIGTYDDESTSDLTSYVTWSSNNNNTTITSNGLAFGVTAGGSTITATLGDVFGTANVTVVIPVDPEAPIVGDYHVTVDGSDDFNSLGTEADPWSLWRSGYPMQPQYAQAAPGDTIVLHAGVYDIPSTTLWVSGTQAAPIKYRPAGDGLVVIRGTLAGNSGGFVLSMNTSYIELRDVIVTCELRNRVNDTSATDKYEGISSQIPIVGQHPGMKVINCIIYDNTGNGISASGNGTDSEYYGNIIFNNGHYASLHSLTGVSHGMYMSNNAGTRIIENNILFNSYGHGIQFYTEAQQQLAGLNINKNIIFNSGGNAESDGYGTMRNFMIGGNSPLKDIFLDGNISYFAPNSLKGTHIQLGYNNDGENVSVLNSYAMGGGNTFIHPLRIKNVIAKHNTVIPAPNNTSPLMQIIYPSNNPVEVYDIDNNTYYSDRTGDVFKTGYVTDYTFTEWKAAGYDVNSVIMALSALTTMIMVYPNKYESGRAHITILNHLKLTNVMVDLSSIYSVGDTYYMYDVQDMDSVMGPFTYDGELVSFPMNLTSVKQSVGNPGTGIIVPHTPIEFGCFVVVKRIIF